MISENSNNTTTQQAYQQYRKPTREIHAGFLNRSYENFKKRKDRLRTIRATAPIFLGEKRALLEEIDSFISTNLFGAEGYSRAEMFRGLILEINLMRCRG